ncbi:MAG: LacI family DNA-binding transcriptional regulator [Bacteroidales bacterium]|nr:LacI family DNA-binding transcriptional regulator [Bacteroidales bacterium]
MASDTLASIAEKAQCSVSTVSRVLSGKAEKYRISEATVARVRKEVEKSNYTPSLIAKGLRAGKTDTIGLLIPGVDDTFFSEIASCIIGEARKLGYTVIVIDTQEDEKNENEGFSTLLARKVDGIIAVPCGRETEAFARVKGAELPLVVVDRYFASGSNFSFVTTDNYKGAVMAVEHFIANGHQDIACIQGNPEAMTCQERVRGYVDTMKAHGLEDRIRISGSKFSIQNGYVETNLVLSGERRPTAILALSNKILLGTVKAVSETGLSIPEDISVISFDDNLLFNYMTPRITCIAQPVQEISLVAVTLLMKKIAGERNVSHLFLPPGIVVRDSVKPVSAPR